MKEFFTKIGTAIKAHKGRTIAISITAFVLVCIIISLCLLNALLFNRLSKGYVPTDAQLAAIKDDPANQYKRVVIIGVDGVGDYFSKAYTPNFDRMFDTEKNASVTYTGTAVYPTISCENWMAMFHGVRPVYHGFIFKDTNQRVEAGKHTDSEKYPSFIKQYLDQVSTGKVFASCTWRGVTNGVIEDDARITKLNSDAEQIYAFLNGETVLSPVTDKEYQKNYMLDENGQQVRKKASNKIEEINAYVKAPVADPKGQLRAFLEAQVYLHGYSDETIAMRDALTVQRVIEANMDAYEEDGTVKYKEKEDGYTISYMHLDQVDHAGHSFGYSKPGYVEAVSRVDNLIGWLYDAFKEADMLEDTLFILCTDHGHRLPGGHKNHGKNTEEEVNITFAIAGKTVKAGKLESRYVNTDLPAIVSYALGVKANENWQGRVPYGMFTLLG